MPQSREQLQQTAERLRGQLDDLDPDLRLVAEGTIALAESDQRMNDAVAACRQAGRSWGQIGMMLHVSKQAAWERFHPLDQSHREASNETGQDVTKSL